MRIIIRLIIFSLIFLFVVYLLNRKIPVADYPHDKEFTREELLSDLERLKKTIIERHPGLNYFTGLQTFSFSADSLKNLLPGGMTVQQFFLMVNPLIVKTRCGHTSLNLPQHIQAQLDTAYRHFPLKLYFQDDRAYVVKNYSPGSAILPGNEILSVNNIPVNSICRNFRLHTSSDGYNLTYKYARMNRMDYGLFPGYPGLPEVYHVQYRHPHDQTVLNEKIPGRYSREIKAHQNYENIREKDFRVLYYEMMDSISTCFMTVRNFVAFGEEEYREFFQETFAGIRRHSMANLIIDLRGNDGGDPFNANALLEWIMPAPYRYFSKTVYGYNALKEIQTHRDDAFRGTLYVLMDGGSFSTTGHLLSILKDHDVGTLIGEESGGSFLCFGCPNELVLPHTGMVLNYTRCVFSTEVSNPILGQGIMPDHPVTPGIEDIIKRKDSVLGFTMQKISRSHR